MREDVRGRSGGRGRTGRGRVPSSSPMLAAASLLAAGILKERPLRGSALPLAHRGTQSKHFSPPEFIFCGNVERPPAFRS